MATDYFDSLSDEDAAALETALGNQDAVLTGKGADADALSGIVQGAPPITENITLYRYYSGLDVGQPLYSFTESGFIVGSTKKPVTKTDAATLAFKIPSGMKAIQVDAENYILDRGQIVYYIPTADGVYPATTEEAQALTASSGPFMKFNTGYIPPVEERESIEEFYNHAHGRGGRFAPGGGSGGGGSGGGGSGDGGNQGQHNRGGQGSRGQNRPGQPQGKFVGVHHGGSKPPSKPGYQGKKETKAEKHLNRTANVVRAITAIAGIVITIATVMRAFDDISNRKQNTADKSVQRQNNLMRLKESKERANPSRRPDFGGDKKADNIFANLNPSGKYVPLRPDQHRGQKGNITS